MDNEEELDEFPLSASLVSCMIKLTREEGVAIKSLINENYAHTFPHYCQCKLDFGGRVDCVN